MCISTNPSTGFCGICAKLKSILKIHFRLHHPLQAHKLIAQLCPNTSKNIKSPRISKRKGVKRERDLDETYASDCEVTDDTSHVENVVIKEEGAEDALKKLETFEDDPDYVLPTKRRVKSTSKSKPKQHASSYEKKRKVKPKVKTVYINVQAAPNKAGNVKSAAKADDNVKYECDICHKSFSAFGLRLHKARMHKEEPKPEVESKETELHLDALKESESKQDAENVSPDEDLPGMETNDPKGVFSCLFCNKTYRKHKFLYNHYKNMHPDEMLDEDLAEFIGKAVPKKRSRAKMECLYCDEVFFVAKEYYKHLRGHGNKKPFLCDICGAGYATAPGLAVHMKEHSGVDMSKCEICNKEFATKTRLMVHSRIHSGEKPFSCEYCGRRFTNISGLKPHLRIHTGEKPFKCHLCPYSSSVRAGLKQHMLNHGEPVLYTCNICDKKFRYKAKYNAHLMKHKGDRRHFCGICNRGFFYLNELRKHENTVHSQARPFACKFCDQSYKRKTHLTRHMVSAHRNQLSQNELPPEQREKVKVSGTNTAKASNLDETEYVIDESMVMHYEQLGKDESGGNTSQISFGNMPTQYVTILDDAYKVVTPKRVNHLQQQSTSGSLTPQRYTAEEHTVQVISNVQKYEPNSVQTISHQQIDNVTHSNVSNLRTDNIQIRIPDTQVSAQQRLVNVGHRGEVIDRQGAGIGGQGAGQTQFEDVSYETDGDWYVSEDNLQIFIPRSGQHH